jgi:hypothetical protein
MKPSLTRLLAGSVLLLAALAFFLGDRGHGSQQPAGKADPGPTKLYFGIAACTPCHTQPTATEPLLCRCTEAAIWEKEDKHKDAFTVLQGERARRMGELLQIKDVSKEKGCVSCHGVFIDEEKLRHRTFQVEDGVSCVACHGAYREWVALHGDVLERDRWRSYSRKVKEEKYGMKDLWDPIQRARLCLSCHLGNAAEGKVITHALYAAGHPPLPSVEIATFSDALPRHWQYLKEKKLEVQKLLHLDHGEIDFEQTKLLVLSGAVALREALGLLSDQAALATREGGQANAWPELAQFDCYACHHDLQKPSWRQQRGFVGTPGRPPMRSWPTALAQRSLGQLGEADKELEKRLKGVHETFAAQPFGKPKEIAAAARQTVDWLDQRIGKLSETRYDRAVAGRFLRALAGLPREEIPDYDSARQFAWAFRIVYGELYDDPGRAPANDRAIRQILETLAKDLRLQLPSGRKQSITDQLEENLKGTSDYDPARFKRAFAELAKLLPAE